jgi:ATP-binding cassette subfamily F protein 3
LLDEPTNHLDIEMRHALTVALQGFQGGLIVVSHDRYLIKTVADTLWLAADGKLKVFDGDLDDYQSWLRARAKAQSGSQAARPEPRKAPSADPAKQWRRELAQIEKKLAVIAAERALIEAELHEAGADLRAKLLEKYARLARDTDKLEARWLEVGTAIEEAGAAGATP